MSRRRRTGKYKISVNVKICDTRWNISCPACFFFIGTKYIQKIIADNLNCRLYTVCSVKAQKLSLRTEHCRTCRNISQYDINVSCLIGSDVLRQKGLFCVKYLRLRLSYLQRYSAVHIAYKHSAAFIISNIHKLIFIRYKNSCWIVQLSLGTVRQNKAAVNFYSFSKFRVHCNYSVVSAVGYIENIIFIPKNIIWIIKMTYIQIFSRN